MFLNKLVKQNSQAKSLASIVQNNFARGMQIHFISKKDYQS